MLPLLLLRRRQWWWLLLLRLWQLGMRLWWWWVLLQLLGRQISAGWHDCQGGPLQLLITLHSLGAAWGLSAALALRLILPLFHGRPKSRLPHTLRRMQRIDHSMSSGSFSEICHVSVGFGAVSALNCRGGDAARVWRSGHQQMSAIVVRVEAGERDSGF